MWGSSVCVSGVCGGGEWCVCVVCVCEWCVWGGSGVCGGSV